MESRYCAAHVRGLRYPDTQENSEINYDVSRPLSDLRCPFASVESTVINFSEFYALPHTSGIPPSYLLFSRPRSSKLEAPPRGEPLIEINCSRNQLRKKAKGGRLIQYRTRSIVVVKISVSVSLTRSLTRGKEQTYTECAFESQSS